METPATASFSGASCPKANHTVSRVEQFKYRHNALEKTTAANMVKKKKTADHFLKVCALCEFGRRYLSETFPKLDLSVFFLIAKKKLKR
jgi:hypothetical protein